MYKLKNHMEDVVAQKSESIIRIMNICKCEKCRLDIMAIALNNLPTKYVVTDKGALFSKLNELVAQYDVDIETEIIKAAINVGKSPKHDNE